MPWVKLDDGFADHPKIEKAGPIASWLHVAALCYAAKHLTDGHVPASKARRLVEVRNIQTHIDKLVEVGLWDIDGDDYMIHDYLDFQPAAETVKAQRERDKSRKRKGRKSQGRDPDSGQVSARNPDGIPTESTGTSARNPKSVTPVPSRPVPGTHLQGYKTTPGVPLLDNPNGGGGSGSIETKVNQAIAAAADQAVTTANPDRPDAYRASIIRRLTTDGTHQQLTNHALDNPHLTPTDLADSIDDLATTQPAEPPPHPAVAATNRPNCNTCHNTGWTETDGTAHPCPKCNPNPNP